MSAWIERFGPPPGDGPTVAVKDLIDVAGSITTAGCRAVADLNHPATTDAPCVAEVVRRGGRLLGKTNLHELAFGTSGVNPWFGMPPNPADPGRVPGGSSSGSAAAVALGEADVALGTDTGGSVRIPAACCGVVGLKTTHGLISLDGVWPLAPSYDTVGVLGADVHRVVIGMRLLGEVFGTETDVPEVIGLALLGPEVTERIDPVISEAIVSALRAAGLGAQQVPVPGWWEALVAHQKLLCAEAWESDRHLLEISGGAGVSVETADRLRSGSACTEAELKDARALGVSWSARLEAAVRRHGVLALPTIGIRPPRPEDFKSGFNALTAPVNLAGFPAISMPVPVAAPGRPPTGLQLVGPPGGEALLCGLAARIEEALAS